MRKSKNRTLKSAIETINVKRISNIQHRFFQTIPIVETATSYLRIIRSSRIISNNFKKGASKS